MHAVINGVEVLSTQRSVGDGGRLQGLNPPLSKRQSAVY